MPKLFLKHVFTSLIWMTLLVGEAGANGPGILFDQGHGQAFLVNREGPLDLSEIARVFSQAGAELGFQRDPFDADTLEGVSGVVISGPFKALNEEEIGALIGFVKRGGKLSVMLHIPHPMSGLLNALGLKASLVPVQEQRYLVRPGQTRDFEVKDLRDHPLTRGLDAYAVYGAWALASINPDAREIAVSSSEAWLDVNGNRLLDGEDGVYPFALAISGRLGKGEFVVFGDDAQFQNQFLEGSNRKLAENLALWMTESDR